MYVLLNTVLHKSSTSCRYENGPFNFIFAKHCYAKNSERIIWISYYSYFEIFEIIQLVKSKISNQCVALIVASCSPKPETTTIANTDNERTQTQQPNDRLNIGVLRCSKENNRMELLLLLSPPSRLSTVIGNSVPCGRTLAIFEENSHRQLSDGIVSYGASVPAADVTAHRYYDIFV